MFTLEIESNTSELFILRAFNPNKLFKLYKYVYVTILGTGCTDNILTLDPIDIRFGYPLLVTITMLQV